jgi:hypothetical protein
MNFHKQDDGIRPGHVDKGSPQCTARILINW